MRPIDAAWLAGLVDGEGSIAILPRRDRNNSITLSLQIAMVDKSAIGRAAKLSNVPIWKQKRPTKDGKAMFSYYRLGIHNRKAYLVLKQIYPYMTTKRREIAKRIIDYYESIPKSMLDKNGNINGAKIRRAHFKSPQFVRSDMIRWSKRR